MSIESEEESCTARSNVQAKGREPTYTYSREEMMTLRELKYARTRPDYLGVDFDGDEGLFSPFKWLQHKWVEEGVKDRPMTRKNEVMRDDCESTVLSPQRRAFSSGCRAPEDKSGEDDGKGRSWRQGSSGGAGAKNDYNKFKNDRNNDKRVGNGTWRNDRWNEAKTDKDRVNNRNDRKPGGRHDDRPERLPEWADGPTSINDMIELKGFDEPKKKKERAGKQDRKKDELPSNGSRPPSNPSSAVVEEHTIPTQQAFPKSDEEFAKFLGLIDNNDQSGQHSDILNDIMNTGISNESQAVTGSRLSRFFKTRDSNGEQGSTGKVQDNQESMGSLENGGSLLSRIFDQKQSKPSVPQLIPTESSSQSRSNAPLTLEDLERGLISHKGDHAGGHRESGHTAGKGNPLEDPREQANLMSKLQRVAREQDNDGGWSSPSGTTQHNGPLPHPSSHLPSHFTGMAPPIPMNPNMIRDPAQLAIAMAQNQYNAAMMQAATVLQGPVPQQIQERIRQVAQANLIAAHKLLASNMAAAQAAQSGLPPSAAAQALLAAAQQQQAQMAAAAAVKRTQATSLIPASVQKKAASGNEEKKHEKTPHEQELEKAEMEKRAIMQRQYTNMMSAMQGGLSMNAWRPSNLPNDAIESVRRPSPQTVNQTHITAMTLAAQQREQAQRKVMMAKKSVPLNTLMGSDDYNSHPQRMQNPLEKLLADAGVQPKEVRVRDSYHSSIPSYMGGGGGGGSSTARPISLEELERSLMETK